MVPLRSKFFNFVIISIALINSADSCSNSIQKIMNGVYLPVNHTITDEPSIVSLRLNGLHLCSGAIVSTQHIVTSAYCVCFLRNTAKNDLRIVLGVSTTKEIGIALTVEKINCHPSLKKGFGYMQHDLINIAIVEAKEGIRFGPKHRIAKLPFFYALPKTINYCYFLGWNRAAKKILNVGLPLQAVYLKFYTKKKCSLMMYKLHADQFINDNLLCAIKEQYDILQVYDRRESVISYDWYDYGAPFFCDDMLLGILSFFYDRPKYSKNDNMLYSITTIQQLYPFFKDVIPEYTLAEAENTVFEL